MQPCVLPARFPNLLVNGSDGIAVGMATNIPPHNLAEVINGVIAQIDNPDITVDELMTYIPGIVKCRIIIDRLFVQIAEHFRSKFRHPRFRITHGGGRIAINRTKISVPVYEREIYRKILRQSNECIINRNIAMRMVFT